MAKCAICGKEISDRAKTCGAKCRRALSRRSVTKGVTIPKCDQSVTVPKVRTLTPAEQGMEDMGFKRAEPKPQSYNSMMVGYVPKREVV